MQEINLKNESALGEIWESGHTGKTYCRNFIRVFAHEISTFLFTITKVTRVQTTVTSQCLLKAFIKAWKGARWGCSACNQSYLRILASCEIFYDGDTYMGDAPKSIWEAYQAAGLNVPQWLRFSEEQRAGCTHMCSTACRFYSHAGCLDMQEVVMEIVHWDSGCCTSGNLQQTERTREKQVMYGSLESICNC